MFENGGNSTICTAMLHNYSSDGGELANIQNYGRTTYFT
jgi:hypothetical protein